MMLSAILRGSTPASRFPVGSSDGDSRAREGHRRHARNVRGMRVSGSDREGSDCFSPVWDGSAFGAVDDCGRRGPRDGDERQCLAGALLLLGGRHGEAGGGRDGGRASGVRGSPSARNTRARLTLPRGRGARSLQQSDAIRSEGSRLERVHVRGSGPDATAFSVDRAFVAPRDCLCVAQAAVGAVDSSRPVRAHVPRRCAPMVEMQKSRDTRGDGVRSGAPKGAQ